MIRVARKYGTLSISKSGDIGIPLYPNPKNLYEIWDKRHGTVPANVHWMLHVSGKCEITHEMLDDLARFFDEETNTHVCQDLLVDYGYDLYRSWDEIESKFGATDA